MALRQYHLNAARARAAWAPAVLLALVVFAPVRAQDDNPFARPGPTAAGPAAAPSPLDSLELRGVLTLGDTTVVTLFDTASSKSTVVSLGATANGITVSDYQAGDDSVLVQSGGRERRVKIKKAQIVTMATPPPTPAQPPAGPQVSGAPPAPAGPPGAAMDDQEVRNRMERVAQEIRRRREMRREIMERAQQQQQQQGQPQQ